MFIPRYVVVLDHTGVLKKPRVRGARIESVSRRMRWDGKELKLRSMCGQPFSGGLFVRFVNSGRTTFVANSEYGKSWLFGQSQVSVNQAANT